MINTTKLLITTMALSLLTTSAYADTIKYIVDIKDIKVDKTYHFTPTTNTVSVKVAGKTCTFGSSLQGSVPKGCNYAITITGDKVTPSKIEADATCLQIKPTCK